MPEPKTQLPPRKNSFWSTTLCGFLMHTLDSFTQQRMFTVPSCGAGTLEWLTEPLPPRGPQVVSGELGRVPHKQFTTNSVLRSSLKAMGAPRE